MLQGWDAAFLGIHIVHIIHIVQIIPIIRIVISTWVH